MVVVGVDADATAAGVNMRVIRGGDFVFATVCRMNNERQKWHRHEALTNIVGHVLNLPKPRIEATTSSVGGWLIAGAESKQQVKSKSSAH